MRYFNTFILILFIAIFGSLAGETHAFLKEVDPSARIMPNIEVKKEDTRVTKLKAYLSYHNSPLADHAEDFVSYADKYNLDWRFVVSVAGVESGYGKRIPTDSFNAWGWGVYGNNIHRFSSWENGIETLSREIRVKYMDRWGAKDIYGIGKRYAANPEWATKVTNFMNKIDAFDPESVKKSPELSIAF